jgi:hypothetical protein
MRGEKVKAAAEIPVGATWKAVDCYGSIGIVYLQERHPKAEIWRWTFCYSDGSGVKQDWNTSRRGAREECSINLHNPVRFKRVK